MEQITWTPALSIGVEEIDRQHKQLIKLVNELLAMDNIRVDSEMISDALTRMTDYANYHFTSEEKFMQEQGYPQFEAHRRQHVEFIRKTAELAIGAIAHRKTVPVEMLEYLKSWLVNHIMISDMKIRDFVERKKISASS